MSDLKIYPYSTLTGSRLTGIAWPLSHSHMIICDPFSEYPIQVREVLLIAWMNAVTDERG